MGPNHETTPESHMPGDQERLTPERGTGAEQHELPPTPTPEQAPARQETREQITGSGAGDNPPPQALPAPAVPQPAAPSRDDDTTTDNNHPANDNPLAADDVDVIEKEWVDRAKKILRDTREDPYQKEHEVSRLQADYLEKRFGVQVKLPQG